VLDLKPKSHLEEGEPAIQSIYNLLNITYYQLVSEIPWKRIQKKALRL